MVRESVHLDLDQEIAGPIFGQPPPQVRIWVKRDVVGFEPEPLVLGLRMFSPRIDIAARAKAGNPQSEKMSPVCP